MRLANDYNMNVYVVFPHCKGGLSVLDYNAIGNIRLPAAIIAHGGVGDVYEVFARATPAEAIEAARAYIGTGQRRGAADRSLPFQPMRPFGGNARRGASLHVLYSPRPGEQP